jgi:RNA polymerase sigma factor (sigma-70 family)
MEAPMDPSPLAHGPELLLSHAGFVRSLARALLAREAARDEASVDVDDVVQQTWLAALARPPRESGALRAWLARVVRSRVREARRSDERRLRRERATAPSEVVADADPARAVERLSVLRNLVDAVLELGEPARAVVIARYFEERTPTEIAALEGVPVATIETRLRRARALLRQRLDARHGDDRAAFLAALVELSRGGVPAAPVGVPMTAAAWVGVAATAALVAWMGWIAWPGGGTTSRGDASSGEVVKAAASDAASNDEIRAARTADPATASAALNDGGVKLRVVAKEGGRPLPGATVRFVEAPADPSERVRVAWLDEESARGRFYSEHRFADGDWYLERQRDLEATAARSGAAHVCDRNGEVTLPPFKLALVSVRQGEFATSNWIERGNASPLLFEVEREVGLRIEVVDRSGRPLAGVPVALQDLVPGNGRPAWGLAIWRGVTAGAGGVAQIPGAEVRQLTSSVPSMRRAELAVALGLADAGSEIVPIDLASLPRDPVRLTLPATGRMHLRLTTPDGAPLLEPASIGIGPDVRHPMFEMRGAAWLWLPVANGTIEIDRVGLGAHYSIYLAVDGDERRDTVAKVAGPTREDETVEVTLAAGPPSTVVVGRLLRPDGEPLRAWPVRAKYDITLNSHERLVETEEDGTFRLPLAVYLFEYDGRPGKSPARPGSSTTSQLTLTPDHAGELDPALASISIGRKLTSEELEPGVHDLGDLQLGAASMIVAGRVVDSDHHPRTDVDIVVEQKRDGAGFMRNVGGVHGRTKEDGSFAIQGAPLPWPLRLVARGDDCFLAQPLDFACGAKGLEVVVEKAGELRGTLLVDAGVPLDDVTLEVSNDFVTYGSWFQDPSENVELAADGHFRVGRLHAARGSLLVALGRRSYGRPTYEPILTIDDVVVKAGEVCDDRRVQTIDLRGTLRPLEITVRDDAGAPLARAVMQITPNGGDTATPASRSEKTDATGVARYAALAATYDIAVEREGFESVKLSGVASSHEFVLHAKR